MHRGTFKRTPEYKKKMSETMKRIKNTPKGRADGRAGALKYWRETRLTQGEIGQKRSEAAIRYFEKCRQEGKSMYWTGKKRPDSTRQKMSRSQRGRHHTAEAKIKISLSRIGSKNPMWKGGRKVTSANYVYILKPNHPFANNKGYVFEHRLIVEKFLGRYLQPDEYVHHCNRNKKDNSPNNLMAFCSHTDHHAFEYGRNVPSDRILFDGRHFNLQLNRPRFKT